MLTVAVIFGGRSSEHAISCATAAGVIPALDPAKYRVVPIGITKAGSWVPISGDLARFRLGGEKLPEVVAEGETVVLPVDQSGDFLVRSVSGELRSLGRIDLAFPLLHGPFGEDGTIQGLFEMLGIAYVGNGIFASAAAMDKAFTKALLRDAGIPVTEYRVVEVAANQVPPSAVELEGLVDELGGYPIFVKPARAGSSQGISKVHGAGELVSALAEALRHDSKVLLERAIIGRELEFAVLEGRGGSAPRVSLAGEIVMRSHEFYDFEAKYLDDGAAELIVPADLTAAELSELQGLAAEAFRAVGGAGLARVDFFLSGSGPVVSEINTMPGFTPISMFPKLWEASGMSWRDLLDELIQLGLASQR